MPGPKMGPRPPDFDEQVIRASPTFAKWLKLKEGEKLRYACREFVRGIDNDEERLMRRIMIARRNNVRDHEVLKKARKTTGHAVRKRGASAISDDQLQSEMDAEAVEKTRSYKAWKELADGDTFVYNQKYTKGAQGHDWLLRKNIWRRMRYRRDNKKMVEGVKFLKPNDGGDDDDDDNNSKPPILVADQAAIEAAVAAAESFQDHTSNNESSTLNESTLVKIESESSSRMEEAASAALDAAAQLAAAMDDKTAQV